ncbi:MAG TPA: tRNA(His) guanylyltransferase Thg1 family protein [Methanosarcina sp.]|nr:tRNA(His) guanylyltransferase Thg1 family protein [Methanosarcina sp.]
MSNTIEDMIDDYILPREDFESMGNFHKGLESGAPAFLPYGLPFVVRLDGRAFHTFTKGLPQPYSHTFSNFMDHITMYLIECTNALTGYVQSDEISLVYKNDQPDGESAPFFGGRTTKILTVLAGMASGYANKILPDFLPDKIEYVPVFDARLSLYASEDDAADNLVWRQQDCIRNSISRMAQCYFSQKELDKVSIYKQLTMLDKLNQYEANWFTSSMQFRGGRLYQRVKVLKTLSEQELANIPEQHRPTDPVMRSIVTQTNLYHFLTQTENLTDFLFRKAKPIKSIIKYRRPS